MSVSNPRTRVLAEITRKKGKLSHPKVLVVGCGRGIEAAVLALDLDAEVIGIDIDTRFDNEAGRYAKLISGDATAIDFPADAFDVVYSYHALEHIPDFHKALSEMHRVLRTGGVWCIGTPNRGRLVGYIGGDSTWREKLAWNWVDWRMRLNGRFHNEYGAHAGFTSKELGEFLACHFTYTHEVTNEYYKRLYARHKSVVSLLINSGIGRFVFPSVYFLGSK